MTTVAELARLTENKLHDSGKTIGQAFWCEEKDIERMELLQGDHVRLKTKGEGPYIGELCYTCNVLLISISNGPLSSEIYILEAALPVHFSCVHCKESSVTMKPVNSYFETS